MHILLLNEYYPPDTSATAKMAAEVAETLAQCHRVTVIAGRPSYDPDEFYSWALLHKRIRNGVTVERVGSTAFPRHDMRKRVSNYLSYTALAIPRAAALHPDVVLAMTDPPFAGIAGALVSKMTGRPFVYNIRDLYPEMAVCGEIVNRSGWTDHWERLHRRALRQATRVIVLGEDMRDRIVAKGIAADRVRIIRDGSLSASPAPDLNDPTVQQIRCGFRFVVVHAGNLGFYGAWSTLVKAAEILRNENVGFVFIGDGANRAALQQQSSTLPNVRFLPFRPVSEIPYVMAAGDMHVVTVRRGLEGVVVPSKLYSILAAGRPVLVVAPATTDAARIVAGERCGVAADPDDAGAVADEIRSLRDNPAKLAEMACSSHKAAEKYARVKELHSFLAVLEEINQTPARNGGGHLDS